MKAIIVDTSKSFVVEKLVDKNYISYSPYNETRDYIIGALYPSIAEFIKYELDYCNHDIINNLCSFYANVIYHSAKEGSLGYIASDTKTEDITAKYLKLLILNRETETGKNDTDTSKISDIARQLDILIWASVR